MHYWALIRVMDKLKSLVLFVLVVVLFYFSAILFGAPLIQKTGGTLLWSILVTALCVLPPLIVLPFKPECWVDIFILLKYNSVKQRYCVYNAVFTILGSWLGAFVILLDWNTSWQVWPVPCCIGAILGSSIGTLLGVYQ